jgi:hypothetical protein
VTNRELRIKTFATGDSETWDRFVRASGVFRESDGKSRYVSHAGASFGGLVLKKDMGIKDISDITLLFLEHVKKLGAASVEIILPPFFYSEKQNNYADFILSREGFGFRKREITSVITLPRTADPVLGMFKNECRTAIKKAIKGGVEVRQCENWDGYYTILKKNLNLRHNVTPAHSLEELKDLHNRFPREILLFGAFVEDNLAGGIVIFKCNNRASTAFYISHDQEYQAFRPVNLLFYEVIKWSIVQKLSYLDFGLFTVNMDPNWGLGKFKEGFGAQGMFRDYYYKTL